MGSTPPLMQGHPRVLPKHCRSALELAEQCRHGKQPAQCHECARCPHGKQRQECRDCNASSRRWCPHSKRKHDCKECSGCPHNRVKRCCKDCSGSAVCAHGRLRKNCRECLKTNDKCPHGRVRSRCNDCRSVGGSVGSASSSEHGGVPLGMVPDARQVPLPPPPPLDGPGVENGGGGMGHDSLSALEDHHKMTHPDDGGVLPEQGAMQMLVVEHGPTSAVPHDPMQMPSGHGLKMHSSTPSHTPKVHRPSSQGGVVDTGVVVVDDGTSSLPPLRLCPHGKPTRECGECVKTLNMPSTPSTPGSLGHEVGKKRPRHDFGGNKGDGTDELKAQGLVGVNGGAGELLAAHMTGAPSDGVVCEHNRLRSQCENCTACRHHKMKSKCKECALCEAHGRLRHDCRDCNSGSRRWCPHNKRKHDCKECSGCPHNKVKRCCKDCNGSAVCPHQRLRKNCRDCKLPPPL